MDEIRQWWDTHYRTPWSRSVNRVYRELGQSLAWPLRRAWETVHGPATDPLEVFHQLQRQAIVEGIQELFEQLSRLAEVGNDTLKPRLAGLVGGEVRGPAAGARGAVQCQLPDMDEDYRTDLRERARCLGPRNPKAVAFLRSLDHVLGIARPAVTVSLAVSGGILAGDVMGQAAAQLAGHTAGQLAAEAAITGGITVGGEAAITATGEGLKHSAGVLFRRLQNRYAELRARWLAGWLRAKLLGDLLPSFAAAPNWPTAPCCATWKTASTHSRRWNTRCRLVRAAARELTWAWEYACHARGHGARAIAGNCHRERRATLAAGKGPATAAQAPPCWHGSLARWGHGHSSAPRGGASRRRTAVNMPQFMADSG